MWLSHQGATPSRLRRQQQKSAHHSPDGCCFGSISEHLATGQPFGQADEYQFLDTLRGGFTECNTAIVMHILAILDRQSLQISHPQQQLALLKSLALAPRPSMVSLM